jgi:hypothetical protein
MKPNLGNNMFKNVWLYVGFLLLEVGNDGLAHQLGIPHHVQHLLVLPVK